MVTGSYTVLARRFRPQGFADVVGQEHVAQALRNAILANRVAHAYLFTGARGVGKTSTARILAKALNCPKSVDGNPCNDCEICDGIAAGNDVDVLEIDGASNRGIDDIRQLRANVNVKSMRTRYKLYIIDEVHMLTKEAFNALLKTLEEPPPNVKFVFCTTEPNKVPDTILSRCQRFDFGTIETSNIKARLLHIAEAEGVDVDDGALELVARRAAGSMRDSQSIFDQLLAFGEEHISAVDVHRLLGTASDDRLIDIGQALVDRDKAKAIDAFHAALDGGVQLGELTDQLLFYLRDLMILASGAASVGLLSVAPVSRELLQKQAESWGLQTIVAAMQILADAKGRMQRVTYGRALAELALVRVAMLEELTGIGDLIESLQSSESVASGQSSAAPTEKKNDVAFGESPRAPDFTSSASDASSENLPKQSPLSQAEALAVAPAVAASTQSEAASPDGDGTLPDGKTSASPGDTAELAPVSTTIDVDEDTASVSDVNVGLDVAAENAPPGVDESESRSENVTEPDTQATIESAAAAVDHGVAAGTADGAALETSAKLVRFTPENATEVWTRVVAKINDMLKSHVKAVSHAAISAPNKLELTLPRKYHHSKRYLEKPETLNRLEQIASGLTGESVRISITVSEEIPAGQQATVAEPVGRQAKRVYKPEEDEFLCSVVEVFSAQVVRISPLVGEIVESDQ
ncbi:MAG: DNA polymerase III subunit gamma/tau [Planctomycetota bacterium]|nr:DNA polymerase III subunit gamma/tau [Planctomycetota bacterium]